MRESDQLKEIRKLHKFLCNHFVQITYHCLFAKCTHSMCCHCPKYPVCATRFMLFLHLCGGRLFSPSPSPYHYAYYLTYHECCVQHGLHLSLPAPDAHMPSAEPPRFEDCPNYVLVSLHDKDKHKSQVHGGQHKRQQPSQSGLPAKAVCH